MKLIHRREINDTLWNRSIAESAFPRVYALTPMLDHVWNTDWHAWVNDDYTVVCPLPDRKKYLLPVVSQPLFMQQLGVFWKSGVELDWEWLLDALQKRYVVGNIYFHSGCTEILNQRKQQEGVQLSERTNYILSLETSYEEMRKSFSENCRRNIKKTENLIYEHLTTEAYESFYFQTRLAEANGIQMSDLKNLLFALKNGKDLYTYKIIGVKDGDEILAAGIYIHFEGRITYISGGSNELGKEKRAMFGIMNEVIKSNAEQPLTLDFEGSNIPSVANFFASFGANEEIYMHLYFNRMRRIWRKS